MVNVLFYLNTVIISEEHSNNYVYPLNYVTQFVNVCMLCTFIYAL